MTVKPWHTMVSMFKLILFNLGQKVGTQQQIIQVCNDEDVRWLYRQWCLVGEKTKNELCKYVKQHCDCMHNCIYSNCKQTMSITAAETELSQSNSKLSIKSAICQVTTGSICCIVQTQSQNLAHCPARKTTLTAEITQQQEGEYRYLYYICYRVLVGW